MNKAQLIDAIHDRVNAHRSDIAAVLDAQADVIAGHLQAGGAGAQATLPGLGKLKAATRAARTGRNPQTGQTVEIPARTAVKFVPGKALADTLNP